MITVFSVAVYGACSEENDPPDFVIANMDNKQEAKEYIRQKYNGGNQGHSSTVVVLKRQLPLPDAPVVLRKLSIRRKGQTLTEPLNS